MLGEEREQIVQFACGGMEDLALAILDIFLKIESDGFGSAEIFHSVRNGYAHFLAKAEEMVNGRTRREYHRCKVLDIDFLLTKLL